MALSDVLFVIGSVAAVLVFGIVYADTTWRGLASSERFVLSTAFGAASFGSVLVPSLFSERLLYAYFTSVERRVVTSSPYEVAAVHLVAGTLLCTGILLYVSGRQSGRR